MKRNDIRASLVAALFLTLAIVSHHFTAMGAVEIISTRHERSRRYRCLDLTCFGRRERGHINTQHESYQRVRRPPRRRQKSLLTTALNNMTRASSYLIR
jgi:hypothetical protein